MPDFWRKHLPHGVPMWIDPTREAFFVTVNCLPRGMNQLAKPEIWQAIEEAIRFREERGDWQWNVILAMPDHFHGIVTFPERCFLKKAMADWKRWLATKHKIRWQDDFFDHRLRSVESAMEKTDYIRMNPVRAALVDRAEDWPFQRRGLDKTACAIKEKEQPLILPFGLFQGMHLSAHLAHAPYVEGAPPDFFIH